MPVDQIPIGTFAHLTRLSKKALHCYDQKGLLVPAAKDLCSWYRYYAIAQIDRAVRIRALVGLGFSLDENGQSRTSRAPARDIDAGGGSICGGHRPDDRETLS